MTATAIRTDRSALLSAGTVPDLRPRYEGCNIGTWIGFKHNNYLVEEALLAHFRAAGLPSRELYERHGLGLELVDLDTRILSALHLDDTVTAEVVPVPGAELGFRVTVTVERDGAPVRALSARAAVALRLDERLGPVEPAPDVLAPYVRDRLGDGPRRPAPAAGAGSAPAAGRGVAGGDDPVLAELTAGRNAFGWRWRIPYPYVHFEERLQMSGYLRVMEEVVDLFLADRGMSIRTMLAEHRWIPACSHSQVRLLDEALIEEDLYTVLTVEDVVKDLLYRCRLDTYVLRGGELVQTATGKVTHGYAEIADRRGWALVPFDDRVLRALRGGPA